MVWKSGRPVQVRNLSAIVLLMMLMVSACSDRNAVPATTTAVPVISTTEPPVPEVPDCQTIAQAVAYQLQYRLIDTSEIRPPDVRPDERVCRTMVRRYGPGNRDVLIYVCSDPVNYGYEPTDDPEDCLAFIRGER